MLASVRWLRELLPGLTAEASQIAERLTRAGLAVNAVRTFGPEPEQIVVAEVERVEPHPTRAALKLVTVLRDHDNQTKVVCGASNLPDTGGLVLLAPLGARLPGRAEIAAAEIGGVRSSGMLVSESELGLGPDAEGLVILPPGAARAGDWLERALPFSRDAILEIDVTPNRPDALGHIGLARELGALYELPFLLPEAGRPARVSDAPLKDFVTVENQDLERCPHYGAGVVIDVTPGPSPLWLRWRLHSLGIRPINNIVDVTNLVLLEYAQPLHAFDLDQVQARRIAIRRARENEPFTTLDGVERRLDPDDLVICDGNGPTALAGVMGGQHSEIRDSTRQVLIECAHFAPRGIRRTSRRHGLHTESSHRFERGTDPAGIDRVLLRAQTLLSLLGGGCAIKETVHQAATTAGPEAISLRESRLNALLGDEVPFDEAVGALGRLGFRVHAVTPDPGSTSGRALAHPASWRPDVSLEVDLIEEVARVRGLDRIPTQLPRAVPQHPSTTGKLEREVAEHAVALGLCEVVSFAFVSPGELTLVNAPEASVKLENPLSLDRSVMRTSLLPGLLEALRRSQRRGQRTARLFSLSALFLPPMSGLPSSAARDARPALETDYGALPEERPAFAAVLAGTRPAHLALQAEEFDVWDAKGLALELVERTLARPARVSSAADAPNARHLHPRGAAEVWVDGVRVGQFGPLHPDVIQASELEGSAQVVELDLAAIEALGRTTPKYRPIPRLPAVTRDVSLVLLEELPAGAVQQVILAAAGELCESVDLVADFRGEPVPTGLRSLTFRLVFRDPKSAADPDQARTLTDPEVEEHLLRLIEAARQKFGAILRG
jgi:phenylalanyl-tRNA synthetase beta chain